MGWDLFFKKPSRNWARENASKPKSPRQAQQPGLPPQPRLPKSLKELRALKNSKPPKLAGPIGDRTGPSHFKPSLPFNIRVPVFTRGELIGGSFVGDEERELARYGGMTERCALRRRSALGGERLPDVDLEDDDEDPRAGSSARKAANATLTKTATSASQVLAVTAAANQISRMTKGRK